MFRGLTHLSACFHISSVGETTSKFKKRIFH